ncbi:MAG: hypothetical protein QXF79_01190 [Ignisphaera sp.]
MNGWATISMHVIEGDSFANAKKVIVIAIGGVFNTDMMIYEYTSKKLLFRATTNLTSIPDVYGLRISTLGNWGKPPTIVEGINAVIAFKLGGEIIVYSLDELGLPKNRVATGRTENYRAIIISNTYGTIWYEVNIVR